MTSSVNDFSKLFSLNSQPMWLFDPVSLRFLDVNDAAIWRYGYQREDFLTMTIRDIRPKEDLAMLQKALDEIGGDQFIAGPVRHILRDGSTREVQIKSYEMTYEDKQAFLIAPVAPSSGEPFAAQLHELIRKLEFSLLKRVSSERERMAELRSLTAELEAGQPVSKQIALISRMKTLLEDNLGPALN